MAKRARSLPRTRSGVRAHGKVIDSHQYDLRIGCCDAKQIAREGNG
jgi:hypothetical protein